MCRSIKILRDPEQFPSEDEIRAAALQYVRKVSGYHKPARVNQAVFDLAVTEISISTQRLLKQLQPANSKI